MILHKNKVTPYTALELFGKIDRTYVRGEKVFDRGEFPSPATGSQIFRSQK